MTDQARFSTADYVVFAGMLSVSAGIGIYHAIAGGGQSSTRAFLVANKSMSFFPVALSVLASFFSASTLLGTPAEIYQFGSMYWIAVFGAVMAPITGAFLFGPLFFNLNVVSVFEYLERRYQSKSVRLFGAFIFLLKTTLGMGIVLYGPSTALGAVTGFPVWPIIIIIGAVCTFYTSLGGIKAVIWTDVFQTLVMLAGMLAVLIQASIKLGGFGRIWDICSENGRISFFDFSPNPHIRHTFWGLTIGMYFIWLLPYTVDQQMVQRFSSTKSLRDAKCALLLNVPGMFILITLCCVVGLALFANYAHCDPLLTKQAANANQLLPLFVLDLLGRLQGVPGLFVASLFSGALSSVSSMLNSLAAITWEDFLKLRFSALSDRKATLVNKLLAVFYGCLGVGVAFLVERLGGTVLQASLTFNGAAGSPLVGIFILGTCFTSSNWIGAIIGGSMGFGFSMWLSIGAYLSKPLDFRLPTTTCGCNGTCNSNVTNFHVDTSHLEGLNNFYGISYVWASTLGVIVTVVLGLIISVATGSTPSENVDENLQLRFFDRMYKHCCTAGFEKRQQERERRKTHLNDGKKVYISTVEENPQKKELKNMSPVSEETVSASRDLEEDNTYM